MSVVFNKLNNINMMSKLLISYILLVFIPVLVVGIILTKSMRDMALDQSVKEATVNADRLEKSINDIMKVPTDFSNILYSDKTLETIVSTNYKSTLDVAEAYWQYTKFDDYLRLYSSIDGIMFYSQNKTILENWRFMKASDEIMNSFWYQDAIKNKGIITWGYIFNKAKNKYTFSMTRMVGTTNNPIGVLVIDLSGSYLYSLLKKEPFDTVVLDESGNIVMSKDIGLVGKQIRELKLPQEIENRDQGVFQTSFNNKESKVIIESFRPQGSISKLKIICAFTIDRITSAANRTSLLNFSIIAISLFVAFMIITIISRIMSNRIKRLSGDVHKIATGNFLYEPAISGKDEIGQLADDIRRMAHSIDQLMIEVHTAGRQKNQLIIKQKEIKLKMLANQINPHFLFNALESIRMKISKTGEVETANIIFLLGKIMRRNLETGSELTTIADEIDIVRSYLNIQKFRYGEKINYSIFMEEGIGQYKIPPLIVQPIVENAMIHGLENICGEGLIEVAVRQEDGFVKISVSDNGIGMDEKKLNTILESINNMDIDSDKKIGLKNVNQRIKLQYGEKYGLSIISSQYCGTHIELCLPGTEGTFIC